MMLDSPTFKPELTPEIALSIIQKSIASRGWKKYDVNQIRLVYEPYWVFSFDITTDQASPSGLGAINAHNGEINDFVPMLFDRPLKKTRETEEGAEVEDSSIGDKEIKETAIIKVANHVGVKKENVTISAVRKHYIPFYRIWVDVADDTYKVDVDACLGAPIGLEQLPARTKDWEESTSDTLQKMKSPKGLMELMGQGVSTGVGALTGKKGPSGPGVYLILGIAIVVLIFLVFIRGGGGSGNVSCNPYPEYVIPPKLFGLLGGGGIQPADEGGMLVVEGQCVFSNPGSAVVSVITARAFIKQGGAEVASNTTYVVNLKPVTDPNLEPVKTFRLVWQDNGLQGFEFGTEVTKGS